MRTPETHYFHHGFIRFFKECGTVYFTIYVYDHNGSNLSSLITEKLKDQEQLEGLRTAKNAEEFYGLGKQSLGSVKT